MDQRQGELTSRFNGRQSRWWPVFRAPGTLIRMRMGRCSVMLGARPGKCVGSGYSALSVVRNVRLGCRGGCLTFAVHGQLCRWASSGISCWAGAVALPLPWRHEGVCHTIEHDMAWVFDRSIGGWPVGVNSCEGPVQAHRDRGYQCDRA